MSDFPKSEQEETQDWKARQSVFNESNRRGGEDYAADVVQRSGTLKPHSANTHPEHIADFRRFAFAAGDKLYVPRFDVYVAHVDDLRTRYTLVAPKIEEGGDTLVHAMYQTIDPVGVGVEGEKNIYVCLKGYNESLEQYTANRHDRTGRPWFIVEDVWLEFDEDELPDEYGDPGEEDIKKYVKVGTFNTKTGFCETFIGQEMYLSYQAPNIPEEGGFDLTNMLTPWWKPTLSHNNNSIRIDRGLNFIPSKVGSDILPVMQWKREFCFSPVGKIIKLKKPTTYFWVKCTMEFNNAELDNDGNDETRSGYLVADKIMHDTNDDLEQGEVEGSIRNYFLVSKAKDGKFFGAKLDANYDIFTTASPAQPEDSQLTKYQYLGSITRGAFGIKHWEWRLNHAFYWNHMCAPVGSFGDTSFGGESAPEEPGENFIPGSVS